LFAMAKDRKLINSDGFIKICFKLLIDN